jgi:hypothetical protein
MGVFDDKKFEELDWISQATEPIDSELNEILGEMPEEIIIDFKTYKEMVGDSYGLDLNIDRMISYALVKFTTKQYLSYQQKDIIRPCFEIHMDSGVDLDFENEVITGTIKFVKIQSTLDEKVLEGMLGREGIEQIHSMYFHGAGLSRANEIMELLGGCEEGLRTRSERRKRQAIKQRLVKLFKTNEWKIKDTELADKVGIWIKSYVVDGNLAAFSNFCRLKVMTHKDQPIYSMEEVQ